MSRLKEIAKRFGGKAAETLAALSEPQRRMLQAAAEQAGVKPEDESSEAASRALIEALAQKIGLPEQSAAANAAKAAGVAALEVFADPLGPLGKLGKGAKVAKMGINRSSKLQNLAAQVKAAEKAGDASGAAKATAEYVSELKRMKDPGSYTPTLNKPSHTVKSPDPDKYVSPDTPGQNVLDYGKMRKERLANKQPVDTITYDWLKPKRK